MCVCQSAFEVLSVVLGKTGSGECRVWWQERKTCRVAWILQVYLPCAVLCPGLLGPVGRFCPCMAPRLYCRAPTFLLRLTSLEAVRPGLHQINLCLVPDLCSSLSLSCSSTPCCFAQLVSPPPPAATRGCCEIMFQKMEQTHLQQRDFKWAGKLAAALHNGDGVQSIIGFPHPARCIFNGSLGLNV